MQAQVSIRLDERLIRHVDREARRRRIRRSALIRKAIEAFLDGEVLLTCDRPFERVRDLIGSVSGGPPDLGERHREHLLEIIRGG